MWLGQNLGRLQGEAKLRPPSYMGNSTPYRLFSFVKATLIFKSVLKLVVALSSQVLT